MQFAPQVGQVSVTVLPDHDHDHAAQDCVPDCGCSWTLRSCASLDHSWTVSDSEQCVEWFLDGIEDKYCQSALWEMILFRHMNTNSRGVQASFTVLPTYYFSRGTVRVAIRHHHQANSAARHHQPPALPHKSIINFATISKSIQEPSSLAEQESCKSPSP